MNQAAESLTGYRKRELLGKSCTVLACNGCKVHAGGKAKHWCSLFARGNIRSRKCLIMNKAGENIHVIKRASLLKDERGEVIGAVETLTDISDVRSARKTKLPACAVRYGNTTVITEYWVTLHL